MYTMILLLYLQSGLDVTLDQANDMKPVELGRLLQQNPPLGCQAEGAWARVAEMCAGPAVSLPSSTAPRKGR